LDGWSLVRPGRGGSGTLGAEKAGTVRERWYVADAVFGELSAEHRLPTLTRIVLGLIFIKEGIRIISARKLTKKETNNFNKGWQK